MTVKLRRWLWLLVLLVLPVLPGTAFAEGQGLWMRADCSTLTGPQAGTTWCFDTTNSRLLVYDGAAWVPLGVMSGGTGAGTFTSGAYLKGAGTSTFTTQAPPIPTADGGTGAGTFTSGAYLKGAGSSPITTQAPPIPSADLGSGSPTSLTFLRGDQTWAVPSGAGSVNVNTTSQATTGTVKETLAAYTLPANSLSSNGKTLRITAWFTMAANANSKTFTIDFGGTTVATRAGTTFGSGYVGFVEAIVVRTGANAQTFVGRNAVSNNSGGNTDSEAAGLESGTLAITDTADITIAATATTPDAAGDVTFKGLIVEALN